MMVRLELGLNVKLLANMEIHSDCNPPGTEDNPIPNRPCLPILNQVINYTHQVVKVTLSIANIGLGLEFIRTLSAAKIKNVVSCGE